MPWKNGKREQQRSEQDDGSEAIACPRSIYPQRIFEVASTVSKRCPVSQNSDPARSTLRLRLGEIQTRSSVLETARSRTVGR
jgi:hypothetical protein